MNIEVEDVGSPTQPSLPTHQDIDPTEHLAIAHRFNIQLPTKEESSKLKTIWDYVKQQGDERPIGDIVWEVINMEQKLGAPSLGETRLDKLYRYVKLRVQESRIQEELRDVSASVNIH